MQVLFKMFPRDNKYVSVLYVYEMLEMLPYLCGKDPLAWN